MSACAHRGPHTATLTQRAPAVNGRHSLLHVCIKNTPFDLHLRLDDAAESGWTFDQLTLNATLVYAEKPDVEVMPIKGAPLTFELARADAHEVTLKARVLALTSKVCAPPRWALR